MDMNPDWVDDNKPDKIAPHEKPGFQNQFESRLVLNFSGFEKSSIENQISNLLRCGRQSGALFEFELKGPDSPPVAESAHDAACSVHAEGDDWHTNTRLVQFGWYDIVSRYDGMKFSGGAISNAAKYLAFFADGTVFRYLKASKLYFFFTIYPMVCWIVAALVSFQLANLITGSLIQPGPMFAWTTIALTIGIWLLLLKWPGDYLYLRTTIGNWGFARDLINRSNPEVEDRMVLFARRMGDEISRSDHDEIVIAGHSFGSVWTISALSLALKEKPGLLDNKKVRILALGSSHLKVALCPKAGWMRRQLEHVLKEKTIYWHEFQSKDDAISFYKADPFEPAGIDAPAGGYSVYYVRFKYGLSNERYQRMKRSLYRTHCQYVRQNDRPVSYDFGLRLFGPLDAEELAEKPELLTDWPNIKAGQL